MRKTNLIQLTVVALLLLGINSQAASASVYFADVPVVTLNEESTPAVIAATEPERKLNSFLPSLDGDFTGTYANFSADDDPALRYNTGSLSNSSAEHSIAFDEFVGPLHGVFIVELYWNGSLAGDIDLYPGWINSTGHLKTGAPAGIGVIMGNYYGGDNPENIYYEVDLNSTQTATLAAHIWAYDNDYIDFYVNATWIQYDEYMDNVGYLENPIPIINQPYEGQVFAVSDLLHDPQRYVPLDYSYTDGIESAWVPSIYNFSAQPAIATAHGGSWMIEIYVNGVDQGQIGGSGLVRMGLAAGDYFIEYLATAGGVLLGSTNVSFSVAGITEGHGYTTMDDTTFSIYHSFIAPTITAPNQLGSGIDVVTLFYFDQGTGNEWTEVAMADEGNGLFSYDITGLINTTNVFYYFEVEDEYGVTTDYYKFDNLVVQYLTDECPVCPDTEDDSPGLLIPLAIVSIGMMAIIRRRK
ncbi:MAG: hypothetical protein ACTSYA_13195 [Candidatus Kariarchaeaceae archaeon]